MAVVLSNFALMSLVLTILFTKPCVCIFSCPYQESQALLSLKEAMNVSDGILSSWVNGSSCCATWKGISCNNVTGHVERVDFSAYTNHRGQGVQIEVISGSLCNLPFVKYLILKSIGLTGTIPSCLGNLYHLHYLQLRNNSLSGKVPTAICQLTNLSYIDLGNNQLSGILPPCLQNLSVLKFLAIAFNQFDARLQLAGLSSLDQLYARNFSFQQDVNSSDLALPSSVKILWISHITVSDTLLDNLTELKFLSLMYSVLNISESWIPHFQLDILFVGSCSIIGGVMPKWLVTQYSLQKLILADDNIVGEIPSWLWENNARLYLLNLSRNHLHGSLTIPNRSVRWMTVLDVSGNELTGHLPSLWPPYLQILMVNGNALIGNIPPTLCNLSQLVKLDLANNKLNGKIRPCFSNYKEIQVLNLGENSLEGSIPRGICSSSLNVRKNKLSGAFPASITNCKSLKVLDIGHNNFAGDIPLSIGNLSSLHVLMMKGNRFSGNIPSEIVNLKQLQILDLSSNNLSGSIPDNISSLHAMSVAREDGHMLSDLFKPYHVFGRDNGLKSYSALSPFDKWLNEIPSHDELNMTVKGLELHYSYILSTLTGIDLSNNQLNGHVPFDFGQLKGLRFLNLSRNDLSGIIPPSMGEMGQLESLDFSRNKFSGNIPPEFQSLTKLACLNLSNNNFSGSIPQGGQMITFENTSYSGNPYLEGCPLAKKCSWPKFSPPLPSTNDMQDENEDNRTQISWYGIGIGFSHLAGFCCVLLFLAVRTGWRKKYFKRVDKILKFLFPYIRNKRL